MKALTKLLCATTAAMAFSAGAAQAGVLNLGGVVVPTAEVGRADGSIFINLANLDTSNGIGEDDFAGASIFGRVNQIGAQDDDPSVTWLNLANGVELTYVIDITGAAVDVENSFLNQNGTGFIILEVAANLNYFLDETPDFQGSDNFVLENADGSEGGQTLWLSAETAHTAHLQLNFLNGELTTLAQVDDFLAFDVTGGEYFSNFDTGGGASPFLNDVVTFSVSASRGANNQNLLEGSTDTQFYAIPEPETIGLLGLGLIGLGIVRRRRS